MFHFIRVDAYEMKGPPVYPDEDSMRHELTLRRLPSPFCGLRARTPGRMLWRATRRCRVVHAAARRKLPSLPLGDATRGSACKRASLFHGQSGAGKTHLIRALRTRCPSRRQSYFGYAR